MKLVILLSGGLVFEGFKGGFFSAPPAFLAANGACACFEEVNFEG